MHTVRAPDGDRDEIPEEGQAAGDLLEKCWPSRGAREKIVDSMRKRFFGQVAARPGVDHDQSVGRQRSMRMS
jgi:hypothetical protein